MFYFGHAKVPFGKIIVKRHVKIIHECQRLTRVFGQTIQQIASGRLLFSATTSWYFRFSYWIGSVAVCNNRLVSSPIFRKRLLRKVVSSRRLGPVHGFLNMTKQFYHRSGPALLALLPNKNQFPKMMRIAQSMQAVDIKIGHPTVMHQPPEKVLQSSVFTQSYFASIRMHEIIGQQLGSQCVLPQAFPAYVNSRLVAMDNPRDHQRSPDSLFRSFQAIVRTLYDGIYRSLTNGNAKQIGHCLRYPFLRQQLVYRKIQQDRPDSRAVLNRSINSRWKFSRMDFPAFASPYFRLMFRDFQIPWRHIKDLPLIMAKQCSIFFIASTTASSVQRMLFRMIRICNLPQAVSGMTRLAAWLPFSFFNQAFWFTKPIGRRRLAAVMAVFRALRFQFLDSCFKSIKFFYEHLDKSNNRVLALKINSPNFVPGHFDRHANKLIHGNRACLVALVNIWCFITKPPQHLVLLGT